MKLPNSLLSLTAAVILIAPIAAQAGTAASASTGKIASLSGVGMRKSASVKSKQNFLPAVGTPILVLGGAGIAAGGYFAVDAITNNKSNGS
jgi:hypothetical protein